MRSAPLRRPFPGQVPAHIACERQRVLHDLIAEKKRTFARSFVGRTLPAITLLRSGGESADCEFSNALSGNYLEVRMQGRHVANQWVKICVEGVEESASGVHLKGRLAAGFVPGCCS